jgi:hypothetical protein
MTEGNTLFMGDISGVVSVLKDMELFLAERGAYFNPKFEIEMGGDVGVKAQIYFDLRKLRQYNRQSK